MSNPSDRDLLSKDYAAKVLVNKCVDGGTVDTHHWMKIPSNTTANLAALPRDAGRIAYDTTLEQLVVDNGTEFVAYVNTSTQTPITALTTYTPTLSDSTNVDINTATWYRHGEHMYIDGMITYSGAGNGAVALTVSIPDGYTIDTAKLTNGSDTSNTAASMMGSGGFYFDNGAGNKFLYPVFNSTTTVKFFENTGVLLSNALASGDGIRYSLKIPITGWTI